jgi:hypothetical protein
MLTTRRRLPQMEAHTPAHDPIDGYRDLVIAILRQAVQDAQGTVLAPGPVAPAQIRAEARAWLQDEAAVADLLELAGIEAALVLSRIRRLLQETAPRSPYRWVNAVAVACVSGSPIARSVSHNRRGRHTPMCIVTIVAIIEERVADPAQYSRLVERLSCGHTGVDHGPTWQGTAAPLKHRPSQYQHLIGRKRKCRACTRTDSPRFPPDC